MQLKDLLFYLISMTMLPPEADLYGAEKNYSYSFLYIIKIQNTSTYYFADHKSNTARLINS